MRGLCLFVFLAIVAPAHAQEQDAAAKKLRGEIAELKARLLKLELDLASLDDKKASQNDINPVKNEGGVSYSLKVGDVGTFGEYFYRVEDVLEGDAGVRLSIGNRRFEFLVKGADAKNLADGTEVAMPGVWAVTGTMRDGGRTYFVVQPRQSGKLVQK